MTLTVTKVYDHDCPICESMGSFDGKVIFDLKPATNAHRVDLDTVLNPEGSSSPEFNALLAQLVERYACNPDYTIDLPVYLVTAGKSYVGHVVGEHTQSELQSKLQKLVSDASNKESEAPENQ